VLGLPGATPREIGLIRRLFVGLRLLQLLFAAAQPLPPRARVDQLGRQLIAARLSEPLILGGVRVRRLCEHPFDLLPNRGVAARRFRRGVAGEEAAIERHQPDGHQPRLRAQRQHLRKGVGQRLLVPGAKAGDRRMIRDPVGRDHPEGDVLAAASLDSAARALPDRVAVEQQRDHHLRVERGPPPAILTIRPRERAQIHLLDGVQHEPGEVIFRQPLTQVRRQQQLLVTVT